MRTYKPSKSLTAFQRHVKNNSGKFLIAMAVLALCRDANGQCEGQWAEGLSSLPGVDGHVYAMTVFNDGTGDALYVGGSFTVAGDTKAANIAKWDGSRWSALGLGMSGSSPYDDDVYALTVFDDGTGPALYAGGEFNTAGGVSANRIARWDGSNWSALGSGITSPNSPAVRTLTVFDDAGGPALFAAGSFTTAGGVNAINIAKWDGVSWSELGTGLNGIARALAVFDDGGGLALFAGGSFTTAGGVSARRIAKWDGANWSALGSGLDATVYALAVFDGDGDGGPVLYASGTFFPISSDPAGYIAEWDGERWSYNYGAGGTALTVFDDGGGPALYAGGYGASNIVKWDGSKGSVLGWGNGTVAALTVFDDGGGPVLYVGGEFNSAGGEIANRVAKWDGVTWSALGAGMNGSVLALAVFDDGSGPALYAGGRFTTAGSISAHNIAKWNGVNWSPLGSGVTGAPAYEGVYALVVFDDGTGPALYAGGNFDSAGGVSTNHIAKWDGTGWSALGSGMNVIVEYLPSVDALAVFEDGGGPALYAGGYFTTAGGASANNIAKWDGTSWSTLGAGLSGSVSDLAVFDGGGGPALFAAGSFSTAGGVSANYLAKWDGADWSGFGLNTVEHSPFYALTVFDDGGGAALYIGGQSQREVGVDASYLLKCNSTYCSHVCWLEGSLYALTVFDDGSGSALYAGGYITGYVAGAWTNNIFKWNGTARTYLGPGVNSSVNALTVFDDGGGPALYAGGNFTIAGGTDFAHFARWSSHSETDSAGFALGMTGPIATPECKPYDYDCDGDVDLQDYKRLLFRMERN